MKLDERALLEFIQILRDGLAYGVDISQMLRDLELVPTADGRLTLAQPAAETEGA